jgi:hypothetical protein
VRLLLVPLLGGLLLLLDLSAVLSFLQHELRT